MDPIKAIAVLGSGVMGVDIALLFAIHKYRVILWHRKDCAIAKDRLVARIEKYKEREILSGAEAKRALCNIDTTRDLAQLFGCDLAVESISECRDEKLKLLRTVCDIKPGLRMVTNTSSLSIEEMAGALPPDAVFAGMHYFNPVLKMELVEIVGCSRTPQAFISELIAVCSKLNKTGVVLKDAPGFIVNRLMVVQISQAIRVYEEGIASVEDIDKAVKAGLAHPIGPLALADLIGLDVVLNILKNIYQKTGNRCFSPPEKLEELVAAGHLGRKTGCGFYAKYN